MKVNRSGPKNGSANGPCVPQNYIEYLHFKNNTLYCICASESISWFKKRNGCLIARSLLLEKRGE